MTWPASAALGAVGGLIVEVVAVWRQLNQWQAARRSTRTTQNSAQLPPVTQFIDPIPDLAVTLTRMIIGAGVCALLHGQIAGLTAAVAVGASGPAVIGQLGSWSNPTASAEPGLEQIAADHT